MSTENKDATLYNSSESIILLTAEYNALREEILKRIELQHQLLSLALIVLGTILTFGLQSKVASTIMLYPILATFLAAAWSANDYRIREIRHYIRVHIEGPASGNIGWENFRVLIRSLPRFSISLNFISSMGIFIGTELLALLVAATLAKYDAVEKILLVLCVIGIILSILILRRGPIKTEAGISSRFD